MPQLLRDIRITRRILAGKLDRLQRILESQLLTDLIVRYCYQVDDHKVR